VIVEVRPSRLPEYRRHGLNRNDSGRSAGWAAFVSAAAAIVTVISSIVFFAAGEPFGTLSDVSSVLQVVLMIPIALILHVVLRLQSQTWSLSALIIGIGGMLIAATFQSLLVADVLTYEQVSRVTLTAGAALGLWLLMVNGLALGNGMLPRTLAWIGMFAGAGYEILVAGFWIGGQQSIVFYIGALGVVIGYPVWAVWLGTVLVSDTFSHLELNEL
jgi:hypothetical protein